MDIINVVLSAVSLVFVVIGVIVAIWTLRADHERRKKQATLEFYQQISELTEPLRNELKKVFGNDVLNISDDRYKNSETLQSSIRYYLRIMERFSVGVNSGVYDINIFMRCCGKSTISYYRKLEPIIHSKRQGGKDYIYSDFEQLVRHMDSIYAKDNTRGNINNS
jgi:hypothetical protein